MLCAACGSELSLQNTDTCDACEALRARSSAYTADTSEPLGHFVNRSRPTFPLGMLPFFRSAAHYYGRLPMVCSFMQCHNWHTVCISVYGFSEAL